VIRPADRLLCEKDGAMRSDKTMTVFQPARTRRRARRGGFTLVELLTVVSIIALLISILVPSFSSVRRQAKVAATRTTIRALDGGCESFRAESTIGGAYPPSCSDNSTGGKDDHWRIANPLYTGSGSALATTHVAGAQLLVFAMLGADRLPEGTPGFVDYNRQNGWWDDQHASSPSDVSGAYCLKAGEPMRPRYGSMVDPNTTTRTCRQLVASSRMAPTTVVSESDATWPNLSTNLAASPGSAWDLPVFVDKFDNPILYYRARRGATLIVTDLNEKPPKVGIYDWRDNEHLTNKAPKGEHKLQTPEGFAAFILDPSVSARPAPYNPDRFLLISPGPDGLYGTKDDVKNWGK